MGKFSNKSSFVWFTPKGWLINNLCIQALRFGSDLADPTEQNRRRSIATLRILRPRIGQRWPKSGMDQCARYLFACPEFNFLHQCVKLEVLLPDLTSD